MVTPGYGWVNDPKYQKPLAETKRTWRKDERNRKRIERADHRKLADLIKKTEKKAKNKAFRPQGHNDTSIEEAAKAFAAKYRKEHSNK